MKHSIQYTFTATIWQHSAPNGWYFVSLPQDISDEIRTHLNWQEEGWGRLKAKAKIGNSAWDTAIWFDKKHNTYLLPLKTAIRTQEKLVINQLIEVWIWV